MKIFTKGVFICQITFLTVVIHAQIKDINLVAYWNFNSVQDNNVLDSVSGKRDNVSGYHRLVASVKGQAIAMDGYISCIVRPNSG